MRCPAGFQEDTAFSVRWPSSPKGVLLPWTRRSATPLTLFHKLTLRLRGADIGYGAAWQPALAVFGDAAGRLSGSTISTFGPVSQAALDDGNELPPPLPWWDNLRFKLHGEFAIESDVLGVWLMSTALPYAMSAARLTIDAVRLKHVTSRISLKGSHLTATIADYVGGAPLPARLMLRRGAAPSAAEGEPEVLMSRRLSSFSTSGASRAPTLVRYPLPPCSLAHVLSGAAPQT